MGQTIPTSGEYYQPELGQKRAAINASSDNAAGNTLIAAVANREIHIYSLTLVAADAVTMTLYSGAADTGTVLMGPCYFTQGGGFNFDREFSARLLTAEGEAFTLLLDSAVQVGGQVTYREEQ